MRVHAELARRSRPPKRCGSRASSASTGSVDRAHARRTSIRRCRPARSRSSVERLEVLSTAETLPFQVAGHAGIPEEQRLRYRFLDLRREKIHANIVLRSKVIASIRRRMQRAGLPRVPDADPDVESPEGARDYLVPSRIHAGKFYALPQAPQQFKQLLMVAGFDRYFQIAPLLPRRGRARRPLAGRVLSARRRDVVRHAGRRVRRDRAGAAGVFQEFSDWTVTPPPFPRIAYDDAMAMYGSDKPDLRNPIKAADVTEIFRGSEFARLRAGGRGRRVVRAIRAPGAGEKSRSFFDKTVGLAETLGLGGLAYIVAADTPQGPAREVPAARSGAARCSTRAGVKPGDAVFFVSGAAEDAVASRRRPAQPPREGARAARGRTRTGSAGSPTSRSSSCDAETNQMAFSHNPFSMPQGGLEALNDERSAVDQGVPVRHRLQRRRAVERRDPESPSRRHAARVRDCRLRPGGSGEAVRRHAQRVPPRRAAARRHRAGHRPDRDAAGAGAEIREVIAFPMTAERGGSADGRAVAGVRQAAAGAAHPDRGVPKEVKSMIAQ